MPMIYTYFQKGLNTFDVLLCVLGCFRAPNTIVSIFSCFDKVFKSKLVVVFEQVTDFFETLKSPVGAGHD